MANESLNRWKQEHFVEWARLTRKRQGLEKMLEKESKDFKNSSVKNVSMITKALRNGFWNIRIGPDFEVLRALLRISPGNRTYDPWQNRYKHDRFSILSIRCSYFNWWTFISHLVCQTCIILWSWIYSIRWCELFYLVLLLKISYQYASLKLWINEKTVKPVRNARFISQSCATKTRLNNLLDQLK